jgi:hypothetical protein
LNIDSGGPISSGGAACEMHGEYCAKNEKRHGDCFHGLILRWQRIRDFRNYAENFEGRAKRRRLKESNDIHRCPRAAPMVISTDRDSRGHVAVPGDSERASSMNNSNDALYDPMAYSYHLIFEDWQETIDRQSVRCESIAAQQEKTSLLDGI